MTPRETPRAEFHGPDPQQATTPLEALMRAAPGDVVAKSSMEEHALGDVLDRLLSSLSEMERDMLMMHVSGLSVRDIAEMTGVSKSQVHIRIPKLMAKVAELLTNSAEVNAYVQPGTDEGTGPQGEREVPVEDQPD